MRYDLLLSWQKTERFVSFSSLVYFSSNCDVPVTLSSRFVLHLCFKRVHLPLTEKTPETERYHMDENHQDKIGSKLSTTMDKIWLPSLSPKDQKRLDHIRRKEAIQPLMIWYPIINAVLVGAIILMLSVDPFNIRPCSIQLPYDERISWAHIRQCLVKSFL
jgi:hypothetical protein